jgi:nucleoside-diphosphate-sugar epimerase/CBS domain-containing protein
MNLTTKLIPSETLMSDDTISDAFKKIDERYGTIITIVDDSNKLCGVISAGDIRKAILNGISILTSLGEVMNRDPVKIRECDLNNTNTIDKILDELTKLYSVSGVMHAMLPVIDEVSTLKGMIDMQSLLRRSSNLDSTFSHRRVLIIGGAGFIGSVLTRQLLDDGWSVRILDNFLYSQDSLSDIENKNLEVFKGDAKDIDAVVNAIEGIDAVVYLAELVGDPAVSIAPKTALKTNYLSVTALAHLCSYLNINRFVYTSSCSVYGASENPDLLLNEESAIRPVSLYGKMKLLVEEAIFSLMSQPNRQFSPTILRLGTVFGHSYRPRFDLVINTMSMNAYSKGEIDIFGGNQWRPHVHVSDVGRAITKVLDAPIEKVREQIFNVGGTKQNCTIDKLGDYIEEVFPNVKINRQATDTDLRNYRVNCDKIKEAIGYEVQTSIVEGIQELKNAMEKGEFEDFNDKRFSNYLSVQELEIN